jgi:hypothetical protein
MKAHIRTYQARQSFSIELDISDNRHPDGITRCIGADLTGNECKQREIAAQAALLMAGYAVSSKHQVLAI